MGKHESKKRFLIAAPTIWECEPLIASLGWKLLVKYNPLLGSLPSIRQSSVCGPPNTKRTMHSTPSNAPVDGQKAHVSRKRKKEKRPLPPTTAIDSHQCPAGPPLNYHLKQHKNISVTASTGIGADIESEQSTTLADKSNGVNNRLQTSSQVDSINDAVDFQVQSKDCENNKIPEQKVKYPYLIASMKPGDPSRISYHVATGTPNIGNTTKFANGQVPIEIAPKPTKSSTVLPSSAVDPRRDFRNLQHVCTQCDQSFHQEQLLVQHLLDEHGPIWVNNQLQFTKTQITPANSSQNAPMKEAVPLSRRKRKKKKKKVAHTNQTHTETYTCWQCGKVFIEQYHLDYHVKRVHCWGPRKQTRKVSVKTASLDC